MATVAILLGVYNGAHFLQEQINSLAEQSWPGIDVWASDDGSSDASVALLERNAAKWTKGSFRVLAGPRNGFAENFRSLITNPDVNADYFAFCDQDDAWDREKLQTAIDWLVHHAPSSPAVFCSRTRLVSETGRAIGFSPRFSKPPTFRNAMVQNIAGANTMVLNKEAWSVLVQGSRTSRFVAHDWWTYLITTGAGGLVHFSDEPLVAYRQHQNNLLGENRSWAARLARIRLAIFGRFAAWNAINLSALTASRHLLTEEAAEVVRLFSAARSETLLKRMQSLFQSGVHRQTTLEQIGLWLASALKLL